MILYLVRHSKAENAHPAGDRQRSLTSEGLRRLELLLPQVQAHHPRPTVLLSSPYLRARQTGDFVRTGLGLAPELQLSGAFTPDSELDDALAELQAWAQTADEVMVFTHNPFVSLLGHRLDADGRAPEFHTPTFAAWEFDGAPAWKSGRLLWTLSP